MSENTFGTLTSGPESIVHTGDNLAVLIYLTSIAVYLAGE